MSRGWCYIVARKLLQSSRKVDSGFNAKDVRVRKSRLMTALVLLVLTGHAFIVSASHFHRAPRLATAASARGAQVGLPDAAQRTPLAGGHEQCLLCRLQRHLVAELQHASTSLDAPRFENPVHGSRPDAYIGQTPLLAPPGRAPPSA